MINCKLIKKTLTSHSLTDLQVAPFYKSVDNPTESFPVLYATVNDDLIGFLVKVRFLLSEHVWQDEES